MIARHRGASVLAGLWWLSGGMSSRAFACGGSLTIRFGARIRQAALLVSIWTIAKGRLQAPFKRRCLPVRSWARQLPHCLCCYSLQCRACAPWPLR